jgi:hypothetical protein
VNTELFLRTGLDTKLPDGQITTRAQAVIARLDRAIQ